MALEAPTQENTEALTARYTELLKVHHDQSVKFRNLRKSSVDPIFRPENQDRIGKINQDMHDAHLKLVEIGRQIGKDNADISNDLLMLDGNLEEYGISAPIITYENQSGKFDDLIANYLSQDSKERIDFLAEEIGNARLILPDEVAIVYGEFLRQHLNNKDEPSMAGDNSHDLDHIDLHYSAGFIERMRGIENFQRSHPEMVRFVKISDGYSHDWQTFYALACKKSDLTDVVKMLSSNPSYWMEENLSPASVRTISPNMLQSEELNTIPEERSMPKCSLNDRELEQMAEDTERRIDLLRKDPHYSKIIDSVEKWNEEMWEESRMNYTGNYDDFDPRKEQDDRERKQMFKDIRRFSQGDKSYTKIVKYFIKNEQDLFTPDLIKQYPVLYEIKDAGGIVSWWDKSTADYRYFWLRNEELREKNKEEFDRLENIVIENLKFLLEKLKSLNGLID